MCCGNEPDPKAVQLPLQGTGQYKEQQAPLVWTRKAPLISTCLWKYELWWGQWSRQKDVRVTSWTKMPPSFFPLVSGGGLRVIKKWRHWSLLAWSSHLRISSCSGPDKCLLVCCVRTHGSETRHRRAMLVATHLPSSLRRKVSEDPPWYFVVIWDYCIWFLTWNRFITIWCLIDMEDGTRGANHFLLLQITA